MVLGARVHYTPLPLFPVTKLQHFDTFHKTLEILCIRQALGYAIVLFQDHNLEMLNTWIGKKL
jgi:hypothetical protein